VASASREADGAALEEEEEEEEEVIMADEGFLHGAYRPGAIYHMLAGEAIEYGGVVRAGPPDDHYPRSAGQRHAAHRHRRSSATLPRVRRRGVEAGTRARGRRAALGVHGVQSHRSSSGIGRPMLFSVCLRVK
jgi:hypothetical protein